VQEFVIFYGMSLRVDGLYCGCRDDVTRTSYEARYRHGPAFEGSRPNRLPSLDKTKEPIRIAGKAHQGWLHMRGVGVSPGKTRTLEPWSRRGGLDAVSMVGTPIDVADLARGRRIDCDAFGPWCRGCGRPGRGDGGDP
jgi:hypothetical protein